MMERRQARPAVSQRQHQERTLKICASILPGSLLSLSSR